MTAAVSDPVLVETPTEGVRLLTLNRPAVRNAMTAEMTARWVEALTAIEADESVRCVVVTGAGPSFCSGADLSWLDQGASDDVTPDKLRTRLRPFYQAWLMPRFMTVPVIAAINGAAVGAGLAVALTCDLRYSAETSVFSAPFLHLGTHPGIATTYLLPETIGIPRAREMLYTGRGVSATEALDWGLVNGISTDPVQQAVAVARTLADAAPIAIRLAKAGLRQAAASLDAALEWEALAQPITMATSDLHEGIQARRAHRPPEFNGR